MTHKLTQQEIDAMANSDDSGGAEVAEEEEYPEEFDDGAEVAEEEYPDDLEVESDVVKQSEQAISEYKIEDEPEVMSEIADQEMDEVPNQTGGQSGFKFKRDEDLSQAQSEFIQSAQLRDNGPIKMSKEGSKKETQVKGKIMSKTQTTKPKKKPAPAKVKKSQPEENKPEKEKLSESEIKRRMKEVKQRQAEIKKMKDEKQKKQDEVRRKEYEQAKKLEEQRKQKNKRILQEQKAKKKQTDSKHELKLKQQDVHIPERRTQFHYMDMAKQRKMNEKKIQQQIEETNKLKLRKLNEKQASQMKGDVKKKAVLDERQYQKDRQARVKRQEAKEQDILLMKQVKKQILDCRQFNKEKTAQINRTQKSINQLSKKLKIKEKQLYDGYSEDTQATQEQSNYFSDPTPIQRFVYAYPEAKSSDEIFRLIDKNGDGVLESSQIKEALEKQGLEEDVINSVYELLDENSDGTVSREEFVFLVDLELKRQKEERRILGELETVDPVDIQARILDMQTKIRFINKQTQQYQISNQDQAYTNKYKQLEQKAKKLEAELKKENEGYKDSNDKNGNANSLAFLTSEFKKLKNEENTKKRFIDQLKSKVKKNLAQKNSLLVARAQENLRLQQDLYRLKNQIQERELRFLSLKKIQENKKGYLQRQGERRRQMEEAYKRTKEYQVAIAEPGRKVQKGIENEKMEFLAAVLMIQRNYRKKKARKQFERLKTEKAQAEQ